MHDQFYNGMIKLWIANTLGFVVSIADLQSVFGLIGTIMNLFVVAYSLYFLHKKAKREDQEHERQQEQKTEQNRDQQTEQKTEK